MHAGSSHEPRVGCPSSLAAEALNCPAPTQLRIVTYIWAGLLLLYLFVFLFCQTRAGMRLRRLPYQQFRTGNVLQRLQVCLAAVLRSACCSRSHLQLHLLTTVSRIAGPAGALGDRPGPQCPHPELVHEPGHVRRLHDHLDGHLPPAAGHDGVLRASAAATNTSCMHGRSKSPALRHPSAAQVITAVTLFPVSTIDASHLVQPLLQQICWTEQSWDGDRALRNAKLLPEYQVLFALVQTGSRPSRMSYADSALICMHACLRACMHTCMLSAADSF